MRHTKLFLSGVFTVAVCSFLHAEERDSSLIYYGNAEIVGKEYIYEAAAPTKKESASQDQNAQPEIYVSDSSCIYIADNAEIYGKELLFAQQNTSSKKELKKPAVVKKETPAPATSDDHEIAKQEPLSVVFPTFPFDPVSSALSEGSNELAAISVQHRINPMHQASKAGRDNTCKNIDNSKVSLYYPEQRQKLSIAATQCGDLTSFGSQSPPAANL